MPIEFACEECGSVLRVPDGTSGKRSRCPTCKHEQEIPWVVSGGQEAVASNKLSIPCPKCQHNLVCSPELLGTRGQCKKCQHIFTISKTPKPTESSAPAFVFHCPKCRQLFEGREEQQGRKAKCYVCETVFHIELESAGKKNKPAVSESATAPQTAPKASTSQSSSAQSSGSPASPAVQPARPQPKPTQPLAGTTASASSLPSAQIKTTVPTISSSDNDELTLLEEIEPQAPARPTRTATSTPTSTSKPKTSSAPIRFECSQCSGLMEVPGSTAGLETECPYCQSLQTIPAESTPVRSAQPTAMTYAPDLYSQTVAPAPAYDPLGGLDLSTANPYAAPAQAWSAPASSYSSSRGSSQVSVGNILKLGLESMFPSCLMIYLHMLIFGLVGGGVQAILVGVARMFRDSVPDPMYLLIPVMIIVGLTNLFLSAQILGAISRMALNAVRKKPFDFGQSFDPGGAFGSAITVFGGGLVILLFMYLPIIVQATTGALTGMQPLMVIWILIFIPVMMIYGFGTSMAMFAGADGEASVDSIQTSFSLIFKNFLTAFGVFFLSGLLAALLLIPTLGCSYLLPIYTTAAFYHLAQKNA